MKPFSQACENNREPILEVLREVLRDTKSVLEIGSGTGQHASFFSEQLPYLSWQPSDLAENLPGIEAWRREYTGSNFLAPVELDVRAKDWSAPVGDAIFSANSLHIMAWSAVQALFEHLRVVAPTRNLLVIYGPFNYRGSYTSESNERFDHWLAQQSPDSAIRDFEAVDQLARDAGYRLQSDYAMPANNRMLVWRKLSQVTRSV